MRPPTGATASFIERVVAEVQGWLTTHEAAYLHALAARGPGQGAIVEIGSHRGKSTLLLADGSRAARRERVYAIDPHGSGSESDFRDNIEQAGLADQVVPLVTTSEEAAAAWRDPVRLLFIDGNHSYDAVRRDVFGWEPFVVAGGVIVLHDTTGHVGPRRLVDETLLRSPGLVLVGVVDSITALRKVARPTRAMRVRAAALAAGRRLYLLMRGRRMPGDLKRLLKRTLRGLSTAD